MNFFLLIITIIYSHLSASYVSEAERVRGIALGASFPGTLFLYDNHGNVGSAALVNHNGKQLILSAAHTFNQPKMKKENRFYVALLPDTIVASPPKFEVLVDGRVGYCFDTNKMSTDIQRAGGQVREVKNIVCPPSFVLPEFKADLEDPASKEKEIIIDASELEKALTTSTSPMQRKQTSSSYQIVHRNKKNEITGLEEHWGEVPPPDMCILQTETSFVIDSSMLPILPIEEVEVGTKLLLEVHGCERDPMVRGKGEYLTFYNTLIDRYKGPKSPIPPAVTEAVYKQHSLGIRRLAVQGRFTRYPNIWESVVLSHPEDLDNDTIFFRDGITTGVIINGMSGGPVIERRTDGPAILHGVVSDTKFLRVPSWFHTDSGKAIGILGGDTAAYDKIMAIPPKIAQRMTAIEPFIKWINEMTSTVSAEVDVSSTPLEAAAALAVSDNGKK